METIKRLNSTAAALAVFFSCSAGTLALEHVLPDKQWHLISLPAAPPADANTVAAVFGDDMPGVYDTHWNIFSYEPGVNKYRKLDPASILEQGRGYWIIQQHDPQITVALDLPDGSRPTPVTETIQCVGSNGCFNIPLATEQAATQWTVAGNPFPISVPLAQIRVVTEQMSAPNDCSDSNGCTLPEARGDASSNASEAGSGIMHDQLWRFDPLAGGYQALQTGGELDPWDGFWVVTLEGADNPPASTNPKLLLPDTCCESRPLIYANNLEYLGAFKVPAGEELSYGGSVITYNQANDSLFIVGHANEQKVAEISIPDPVDNTSPAQLNRATFLQTPVDITEGNLENIADGGADSFSNGVHIGGLLVYDEKLIGTAYAFYSTDATLSHFTSGLTLSTIDDFSGMFAVGALQAPTASFVSGWMTDIPADLHADLGGPALTGNGSLSVLSRTSFGPAAFAFDPARLGTEDDVPVTPLLYYPEEHQTLNANGYFSHSPHTVWNSTTKMAGMTMISGSRSILYFGYHGIGKHGYGQPSDNPIYADVCRAPDACIMGPEEWPVCEDPSHCTTGRKGLPFDPQCIGSGSDGCFYDPTEMGAKGPHAYPYVYQVWAYDADELASVKNGFKEPWDVQPYAVWQLPFPVTPTHLFGGAAAYDSVRGKLYVTAPQAETHGCCEKLPLIHVFRINLNATPAPSYKIGGKVVLLKGSVTIRNNANDELTITSADRGTIQDFSFAAPVARDGSYEVSIAVQPEEGTCTVYHGSNTVKAAADIENILVYCDK
jgi:hypothetical protein